MAKRLVIAILVALTCLPMQVSAAPFARDNTATLSVPIREAFTTVSLPQEESRLLEQPHDDQKARPLAYYYDAIVGKAGTRIADETIQLFKNAEKVYRAEQRTGMLGKDIESITADEYGTEGRITFIPNKTGKLFVCGDLHGDFASLKAFYEDSHLIERLAKGENCHVVFLGDYCDIGTKKTEVWESILSLKVSFPANVTLLAGNHEWREENRLETEYWCRTGILGTMNTEQSFIERFGTDDGSEIIDQLQNIINTLPIIAVTRNRIIFAHAGHLSLGQMSSSPDFEKNGLQTLSADVDLIKEMTEAFIRREDNKHDEGASTPRANHQIVGKASFDKFMSVVHAAVFVRGHDRNCPWDLTYFDGKMLSIITTGYTSPDYGYPSSDRIISRYAQFDFSTIYTTIDPQRIVKKLDPSGVRVGIREFDPKTTDIMAGVNEKVNQTVSVVRAESGNSIISKNGVEDKFAGYSAWAKQPFSDFEQNVMKKGYTTVTTVSSGNLYHNDYFIVFRGGDDPRLFSRLNEPFAERQYTCFVVWKDTHVTIEPLEFDTVKGNYRAFRAGEEHVPENDISRSINFATYGQQLIKNGSAVPMNTLRNEFDDLFHLFALPQSFSYLDDKKIRRKYDRPIGHDEMFIGYPAKHGSVNGKQLDRVLVGEALSGKPVTLDISSYSMDLVKNALRIRGYHAVDDEKWLSEEGRYILDEKAQTLRIRLYRMRMSHELIGITKSGKVVAYAFVGNKNDNIGVTPEEARERVQNIQEQKNDPIENLLLLSNGGDVFVRENGEFTVPNKRQYDSASSVIMFAQKKNTTEDLKTRWDEKLAFRNRKALEYDPRNPDFCRYDPAWDVGSKKCIMVKGRENAIVTTFKPGDGRVVPFGVDENTWFKNREQDMIPNLPINGRRYDIATNVRPILPYMMLFVAHARSLSEARAHLQWLDADRIDDFMSFQWEHPGILGYFNSFEAGASMKQFHIQMFLRESIPGDIPVAFELATMPYKDVFVSNDVRIRRSFDDDARSVYAFELQKEGNEKLLADYAGRFAEIVQKHNIPHNVIFIGGKVYFILREPAAEVYEKAIGRFNKKKADALLYEYQKQARAYGGLEAGFDIFTFYKPEARNAYKDNAAIAAYHRKFRLDAGVGALLVKEFGLSIRENQKQVLTAA